MTTTVGIAVAAATTIVGFFIVIAVGLLVSAATSGWGIYVCEQACNAPIRGTGAGGGT